MPAIDVIVRFPRVYAVSEDLTLYDVAQRIEQDRIDLGIKHAQLKAKIAKLHEDAAKLGGDS